MLEKCHLLKLWPVIEAVRNNFPSKRIFLHFYKDASSSEKKKKKKDMIIIKGQITPPNLYAKQNTSCKDRPTAIVVLLYTPLKYVTNYTCIHLVTSSTNANPILILLIKFKNLSMKFLNCLLLMSYVSSY
jgi:hypothetical protein